jgi:Sigma-70, region 4
MPTERPYCRKRSFDDLDPDLAIYRQRTIQFLRRYFRMSMEVGRVPSMLGREVFRARVTSYRMGTFEDTVIFVHDVESCLQKLDPESQALIARIVFQDYSHEEAAAIFGCTPRTLTRRFPEAIDRMTQILIDCGLLERIGRIRSRGKVWTDASRQEVEEIDASSDEMYAAPIVPASTYASVQV